METSLSEDLSSEINAAAQRAHEVAARIRRDAQEALRHAVECGELLLRQRAAMPYGTWETWLSEKCHHLSHRTARRYMRLARNHNESISCEARSLRHAYLLTGVIPRPKHARRDLPGTPTITFTHGLDEFRRWYNRRIATVPLKSWSPLARKALRNELRWFRNLFDQLSVEPEGERNQELATRNGNRENCAEHEHLRGFRGTTS